MWIAGGPSSLAENSCKQASQTGLARSWSGPAIALRQFSDQHIAALAVMVVSAGVSIWAARRHPGRWIELYSRGLALLILAGWVGEYVADAVLSIWTARYSLPLQLTDAVSAVSILALLTRRPLFIELAYFWAFTATLQAVLTPDLGQAFPSVFYFTYFTYHVGAIVAASFLVFGCRLYPTSGAVWRVFAATLAFTAVSAAGDLLTGGNYMYLRNKPVHGSLLSLLGPWPWYIVAGAVVALAMLLVVAGLTRAVRALVDPGLLSEQRPIPAARGAAAG
jgi:hypothetical integral membrane protein (TIGR02206 family)